LGVGESDIVGSFESGFWGETAIVDEVGDGERLLWLFEGGASGEEFEN
jgi:hypothetical protein